jgi:hypothetical protein
MLTVILSEDDAFSRAVAHRSRLQKYSVIRYRDPVKLADSLPELNPDVLIIRFEDYPLHAELLAAEILCRENRHEVKIIVFAAADIDSNHFFGNLRCLPEMTGSPDSGHLSQESSKILSELLSPSLPAVNFSHSLDADENNSSGEGKRKHGPRSRLMAAAEKQTRSIR